MSCPLESPKVNTKQPCLQNDTQQNRNPDLDIESEKEDDEEEPGRSALILKFNDFTDYEFIKAFLI